MAEKLSRGMRLERVFVDQAASRRRNGPRKRRERDRRDRRMLAAISEHELPYAPGVMSWLCRKLDKQASRITNAEVKALLK